MHSVLARHVTNERVIFEHIPGQKPRGRWHRFGQQHLFDCLAEAYVGICRLGYQPPALARGLENIDDELAGQVTEATPSVAAALQTQAKSIEEIAPNRAKINSWFQDQG